MKRIRFDKEVVLLERYWRRPSYIPTWKLIRKAKGIKRPMFVHDTEYPTFIHTDVILRTENTTVFKSGKGTTRQSIEKYRKLSYAFAPSTETTSLQEADHQTAGVTKGPVRI